MDGRTFYFYCPNLETFFTPRPDSSEASEGLYEKKGFPAELKCKFINFCPKKVLLVLGDTWWQVQDPCQTAFPVPQQSQQGEQGTKERGYPRKVTISKSYVSSIFHAWPLASSVSVWMITAGRGNVFHMMQIQEKQDWCEEDSRFRNNELHLAEKPLGCHKSTKLRDGTLQLPLEEAELTCQTTDQGKSCSVFTLDCCLILKSPSCAFTQRKVKLCFSLKTKKYYCSIPGLQNPQTQLLVESHPGNPVYRTKRYGKKEVKW